MRRFLRENSLSLVFGALFLAALVGQAFAGHADFNQQQLAERLPPVSLGRYLTRVGGPGFAPLGPGQGLPAKLGDHWETGPAPGRRI
jgi:hypothetical protein